MCPQVEFPSFTYDPTRYNADLIRGVDLALRSCDPSETILSIISSDGVLVDVGCGSAKKVLPLASLVKSIIGIDKNQAVISQAAANLKHLGISNIHLAVGDCHDLPLQSEAVDMVSFMLSPHNADEAFRVLKPGGHVVADRVGEQDKVELKSFFVDVDGNSRGYRSKMGKGEIARVHQEDFERAGFQEVICKDYFWQTRYIQEGLWALLSSTPTIKGFNNESDRKSFEQACAELSTPEGITLTQHRVLVIAQK